MGTRPQRKNCQCPQGVCLAMTDENTRCRAEEPHIEHAEDDAERVRYITELGRACVRIAADYGCVIRIEQRSLTPPAMGHYETVVDVRVKR